MPEPLVRVRPLGGEWTALGAGLARGVVPQGLSCTVTEWGPDQCSFTLARDSRLPWADLLPFADLEVEAPGAGLIWSGRIWDTSYGDGTSIGVTARGWQYSLDDHLLARAWAHQRLPDWQEMLSFPGTLGFPGEFANGSTLNGRQSGYLAWGMAGGTTLPTAANGGRSGFYLDGGEAGAWKRVIVDWESANNTGSIETYLYTASDTDPSAYTSFASLGNWNSGASGTLATTLATARRYISLVASNNGGGAYTPLGATWFRVKRVLAVRSTAYEAANQSDLTATEILTDLLAGMTWLSSSTSRIATTSFGIPHFAYIGQPVSARSMIQAANAYHDYLVGVDADRQLYLVQRPSSPTLEIGEWSGATFADAGDSADELYNSVTVTGTGVDGRPLSVTRTATSSLLSAAGITRSRTLTVDAAITQASAEVIGDAWLANRSARPTRGTITCSGGRSIRALDSGAYMSAASLLRKVGERIRLSHRWDPDTGAWGRDASITSATWTADGDQVALTLDSPRDRIETVLGRYAAVRGAGRPLGAS